MDTLRRHWLPVVRGITGLVFVVLGTLHFTKTRSYEGVMPPYLPAHRELVLISGAAEIAGGVGVWVPATRRQARWGLIALLIAVFPANVHMALNPKQYGLPPWILWARLPLQPVFGAIVWRVTAEDRG